MLAGAPPTNLELVADVTEDMSTVDTSYTRGAGHGGGEAGGGAGGAGGGDGGAGDEGGESGDGGISGAIGGGEGNVLMYKLQSYEAEV